MNKAIQVDQFKLLIYFNEYTQKIEASIAYELVFESLVTVFYNNPKDQNASTNFLIFSGPSTGTSSLSFSEAIMLISLLTTPERMIYSSLIEKDKASSEGL